MTQTAIDQTAQEISLLVVTQPNDDFDDITTHVARRLGRLLDYQRQHHVNVLFELIEQAENSDEVEVLTKAYQLIGE